MQTQANEHAHAHTRAARSGCCESRSWQATRLAAALAGRLVGWCASARPRLASLTQQNVLDRERGHPVLLLVEDGQADRAAGEDVGVEDGGRELACTTSHQHAHAHTHTWAKMGRQQGDARPAGYACRLRWTVARCPCCGELGAAGLGSHVGGLEGNSSLNSIDSLYTPPAHADCTGETKQQRQRRHAVARLAERMTECCKAGRARDRTPPTDAFPGMPHSHFIRSMLPSAFFDGLA